MSCAIKDFRTKNISIENMRVYGLENSIRVAKFPKSVKTDKEDYKAKEFHSILGSCKAGSGHDCFLKGIVAQFDLTIPQYMWMQAERYHFFDIVSSQSKMHKILSMDIEKQCNDYVEEKIISILKELIEEYNNEKNNIFKEIIFKKILSNCPMGLMLTAGITTNYLQLKTIYYQRKNHRLDEWKDFCYVIESLPMFKELILGGNV